MLELERIDNEVFHNGRKLTIVAQATKGPGKEVVKVEGLEGSNGQKWISLSRLQPGINKIECQERNVTLRKKYELTKEEQEEVNKLQAQIDAIIEKAKARYVEPINLNKIDPTKLSEDEKQALIARLQNMILGAKA